jgi:hypothetical protein
MRELFAILLTSPVSTSMVLMLTALRRLLWKTLSEVLKWLRDLVA